MLYSSLRKLLSNWTKLVSSSLVGILGLMMAIYLSSDLPVKNASLVQGANMSKVKVSVSVDDAHIEQILEVAQDLQSAGMDVEQTLPTVGVISGSIDSRDVDSLSQVEGVRHIEPERSYQLAPPDSDIQ
jgi:hypothetical protein